MELKDQICNAASSPQGNKQTLHVLKRGLGGPQASLDVLEKIESLSIAKNKTPSHPVTIPLMSGCHGEQYVVLPPPYS
jgi:hypothetical protein